MAVLSLCKRGMGTPAECLAFCDNEEKSKSPFHCGICTGTVHDHLKKGGGGGIARRQSRGERRPGSSLTKPEANTPEPNNPLFKKG